MKPDIRNPITRFMLFFFPKEKTWKAFRISLFLILSGSSNWIIVKGYFSKEHTDLENVNILLLQVFKYLRHKIYGIYIFKNLTYNALLSTTIITNEFKGLR